MEGLNAIEADIQLCERFLDMDARNSKQASNRAGSASVGPRSEARESRITAASLASSSAPGSSSNMSQQRRKEILDRLLAERSASKKMAASSANSNGHSKAAPPGVSLGGHTEVEKPGKRNDAGGSGKVGNETRDELIQRLIKEKREREARSQQDESGVQSALQSTNQACKDQAGPNLRKAWAELSQTVGRRSPDTDSLDNEVLISGKGEVGAQFCTNAAKRRPRPPTSTAKRPASAPRQRMSVDGRLVSGLDIMDVNSISNRDFDAREIQSPARPQSAREATARSLRRDRPFTTAAKHTRPMSPNLSKSADTHSKERNSRQMEQDMRQHLPSNASIYEHMHGEGEGRYEGEGQRKFHGERVAYLAQSKKAIWEARERAKLQREEEQRRQCSFKPKLVARTGASPSKVPVEIRLLNTASNKQALRQRAKRHLEEQELIKTCNGNTFRPKINAASRLLDKTARPLHERVGQLQRERQQKLQEAKLKLEAENSDLTFKPEMNDKSLRLAARIAAETHMQNAPMAERLLAQNHLSVHKRLKKVAAIEDQRAQEERFQPEINRNSEKILEHSEKFAGKDFFDRQAELLERKLSLCNSTLNEFSFAPDVGSVPSALLAERSKETVEQRLERLAYRDKDQVASAREAMREDYYAQFQYRPQINEISRQLGQAHTIEELHTDAARKERMELLRNARIHQLQEECTFRPKVSKRPPPGSVSASLNTSLSSLSHAAYAHEELRGAALERSRYSIDVMDVDTLMQRITDKEREKMAQCQQVKKKKEYEQLKECTFTPHINRAVPKQPAGPIVVRGLGRHLELKELAQRQAEEKAERERKAFLTHVPPAPPKHYTVPTPFTLSSNNKKHQEKKEELRRAVEGIAMAECTFQPHTNEGAVRTLLHNILDHDPSQLYKMR